MVLSLINTGQGHELKSNPHVFSDHKQKVSKFPFQTNDYDLPKTHRCNNCTGTVA
jgi:hypothetical protein